VLWGNNGIKRQGISKNRMPTPAAVSLFETHPAVNGGQIPLDNFPPDTR
jgi:hypothetical protein